MWNMKLKRHYEASSKRENVKSAPTTPKVCLFQAGPLHLLPTFDFRVQRIIAWSGYLRTLHRPSLIEVEIYIKYNGVHSIMTCIVGSG
jgi:hypothetical protein